jgi:hypothetical protein
MKSADPGGTPIHMPRAIGSPSGSDPAKSAGCAFPEKPMVHRVA